MRASRRITICTHHFDAAVREGHSNPILTAARERFPSIKVDRKEPFLIDEDGSWIVAKTSQARFVQRFRKLGKIATGVAVLLPCIGAKT